MALTALVLLGIVFLLVAPWLRLLLVRRSKVLRTSLDPASYWEPALPVPRDIKALLRQY